MVEAANVGEGGCNRGTVRLETYAGKRAGGRHPGVSAWADCLGCLSGRASHQAVHPVRGVCLTTYSLLLTAYYLLLSTYYLLRTRPCILSEV